MPVIAAVLFWLALSPPAYAQAVPRDAVPQDAIPAIVDLFKTYQVVGMGEGPHGNLEGHAFRFELLKDPRFHTVVNDILVECGTARYQAEMDRYIRGEAVPRLELRRAWEDTTNPGPICDRPIYEELFTAIRTVNAPLPANRKLRLLLGDPPIAWEAIRKRADLRPWHMQRDLHAAAVLKRESFAKGRKVLAIYGDGHFQGRGFRANSLVNVIERAYPMPPASLCRDPAYMTMRRARLAATSAPGSTAAVDQLNQLCTELTRQR